MNDDSESREPTPGPWSARSTGTEIVIYHPYEGGKHRIARVKDCRYWDVNAQGCGSKSPMANARLIAAAPDLRDALLEAVEDCETCGGDGMETYTGQPGLKKCSDCQTYRDALEAAGVTP